VILVARANGALHSETPSTETVLGYLPGDAGALSLDGVLHPDDAPTAIASIKAMLGGTRSGPIRAEWRVRHADGRWLDMEVIGNDLSADAQVAGVALTMRDVSERKSLEQELRHLAFHDSLTNLANRVLFNDRVDHALSRRSRSANWVSVLLIDIDDFKVINDTLGHAAADEVLVQLAGRLQDRLRDGDTAARLGGDEFGVCIEFDDHIQADVAGMAQRILDALGPPFQAAGDEVRARVSIQVQA